MKTKILLGIIAFLLILVIAAGAFWWSRRPQVITLDDGTKLTLLAVDYGKRHTPPAVKLPAARGRRGNGSFTTQNSALCVWFRRDYTNNTYFNAQFYIYDKAGTACVESSGRNGGYGGGQQKGSDLIAVWFDSFPREQSKLIVRVQEWGQDEGQVMSAKHFVISNPSRGGSFPKWTAESLPATKTDGDFSATLTQLSYGDVGNFNRDQDDPNDAINNGVEAVFQVQQNGTNAVNWSVAQIETSDATGNHQSAGVNSHWDGDNLVADYQFGLWPGQPWKLRVEFSKQSGYDDSELWTVKNIPLEPGTQRDFDNWNRNNRTNRPFAETDLNGIHLKLYPAKKFTDVSPDQQPQGGFELQTTPGPGNGLQLNLVKITDDQGDELENWNSGSSYNGNFADYHYGIRNLDGVTNLTVTIAVHQDHYLEFTANPEKAQ
ncbi:MAG TPA: hypothetical protein VMB22_08000 [Verrucomicrobiae bacterium]|nr:hypothetical protein [Verrucomicrobiae bacterium]